MNSSSSASNWLSYSCDALCWMSDRHLLWVQLGIALASWIDLLWLHFAGSSFAAIWSESCVCLQQTQPSTSGGASRFYGGCLRGRSPFASQWQLPLSTSSYKIADKLHFLQDYWVHAECYYRAQHSVSSSPSVFWFFDFAFFWTSIGLKMVALLIDCLIVSFFAIIDQEE